MEPQRQRLSITDSGLLKTFYHGLLKTFYHKLLKTFYHELLVANARLVRVECEREIWILILIY